MNASGDAIAIWRQRMDGYTDYNILTYRYVVGQGWTDATRLTVTTDRAE